MLTSVERVLILKGADLLRDVGPRRLLALAEVAREVELEKEDVIYQEEDAADALYMVVEGRVRLSAGGQTISEVGPGEAFGTWALVDDSERGQRAECIEDGLALALHRDSFYDVAAGDLALLQEVVRALARRLRALVSERPEEARVEGEGVEKPEALVQAAALESDAAADAAPAREGLTPAGPAPEGQAPEGSTPTGPALEAPALEAPALEGPALVAAVLGKSPPDGEAPTPRDVAPPPPVGAASDDSIGADPDDAPSPPKT